ncbi:threonylcarbamoyl-AMP synthase [Sphaerisporangium rufum]|uniref:L-threonylcarbamoyladenylate synthase n=1 Tax=Sphaerisporangium rufum TaxID=1381558 RepID=A0A919UZ35_9ACTN|nr:threonylcarbamoyl-AMP synthase [Sphaerisporangium rufum]
MSRRYDCSDAEGRTAGLAAAVTAVQAGELVVLPTDTVYGIGADAFSPSAVMALLEAKGRGRDMPVPVLVGTVRAATALVEDLGTYGQDLIDTFWPGPLTIICRVSRSLNWDLGDTKGTVAVRMPLHAVALELLKETGPMAVSSANRSGAPPATTAAEAEEQLGESVAVYLDAGPCADNVPSTIVDLTTAVPRVLRQGAISVGRLRGVIGYVATDSGHEDEPAAPATAAAPAPAPSAGEQPADGTDPADDRRPVHDVPAAGDVRPANAADRADDVRPSDAVKPADGVKPVDTEEPVDEVKPVDGVKPAAEAGPADGAKPVDEAKPVDGETPAAEAKPAAVDERVNGAKPGDPAGRPTGPEGPAAG